MPEQVTLSIDVGTTTIVAARADRADAADVMLREPAILSVEGDNVLVGAAAAEVAALQPDATVSQLVRRVGDSSPVVLGGRAFGVAELLGNLAHHVVTTTGIDPSTSRLVLTHPANWRDHRLELLRTVGRTAGFSAVDLVSEPLAAASHGAGDVTGGPTLVVDVGGGTSDATLVGRSESGAGEIIATQSLERLGGGDFDQAVFQHVTAAVDDMISALDRRDPAVRAGIMAVRSRCTAAKERLSTETDATIDLDLPGLNTTVRITRAEFESLIRPQIDAVGALVERVLSGAAMSPADLGAIVVVGGSAPIPLLAESLAGTLGRGVTVSGDPGTAVALGAAAYRSDTTDTTTDSAAPDSAGTNSKEEGHAMSNDTDGPAETAAAPGADGAPGATRTPPPPPPSAAPGGPSTGAKVAAGAVAAAAAAAVGVLFGDDIADALTGDDGEAAPDLDDSMDEFDAVAAPDTPGPVGEPLDVGTDAPSAPAGVGAADAGPVGRPARPSQREDAGPGPSDSPPVREPGARRDPARPEPQPAAPDAATSAAPAAQTSAAPSAQAGAAENAEFEAARATLLERLENFEAPEGTSPEDAAALRQELADAVEAFQPGPGQTTQSALAALRDDVDRRVQDFVQDQKLDAVIEEVEADNRAEAAAAAAAATPPADDISAPIDVDAADEDAVTEDPTAPTPDASATDAPTTDASTTDTPATESPAPDAPVDETSVDAPVDDTPIDDASVDDTPVDDASVEGIDVTDIPIHDGPPRPIDPDITLTEPVGADLGLEDDFDAAVIQFERPPAAAFAVDEPLVIDGGGIDVQPAAMTDVMGESVYADVVDAAPLIVEPVMVGPDIISPVDFAPDVVEVPRVPEGFEPPVYIEPEPIEIGHLATDLDDAGDFNLQGLEDEGDIAVLDADPGVIE